MKKKMFSILLTLVLVLSLGLVTAAPVAASPDLDEVTITVSPATATATAKYQVDFFVHTGLTDEVNCFVIEFPAGTTVPSTIAEANVVIYDITAPSGAQIPSDVVVDGQVVYVYIPVGGPGIIAFHYGRVVFKVGAGIENPDATGTETFCAWVYSDEESTPVQACYNIYETVPIDVFLKYQIPPADCGIVEDIPVGSFLTIGEALGFVDELYLSGDAGFDAIFTLDGAISLWEYGDFGTTTPGDWDDNGPIEDTLSADTITATDAANETFTVTYNESDGDPASKTLTIDSGGNPSWSGGAPANVVDVVSVEGETWGATAGYQTTFNLTGSTWNNTAGDYGDYGITTVGWTDGTSIGEVVTLDVTGNPTTNPETYTVTYWTDDATGAHKASLTIQTDGNPVWSPAGLPSNVVDVDVLEETPAWSWEAECPTDGGLIGARVLVKDGTYMETFTIRTPGVMVESLNGAEVTIIDATGLDPAGVPVTHHCAAVMIAAEGVTFGGTGDVGHKGFTVKNAGVGVDAGGIGGASTLWADENSDGIADVSGVYVWPNGGASPMRAKTGHDAWCRVNVIGNIIYGSQGTGIRADARIGTYSLPGVSVYVGECTVYDNLFDGFHGDDLCCGPLWLDPGYTFTTQHGDNEWGNTAIVGNDFYHNGGSGMGDPYKGGWTDAGIEIGSTFDFPYGLETCYIVHNNIHDNTHAGIYLLGHAADDTLVIKFNQIVDNGVFGISTRAQDPWNIACVYNNIEGNTDWGIKNWYDDLLHANWNWWNHRSGPSCGPEPEPHELSQQSDALGQGDAVSHWVRYQWWLTYPFEDLQADLIRYHGGDSVFGFAPVVDLVEGWNTLSTPTALDERADQMGEIRALGGWMQNMVIAYFYDPVGGWDLVTDDFQLLPLEAIYIRMSGPDTLPILLRSTNWMPARVLEPGWNLVSLNTQIRIGFPGMQVDEALASIAGSWGNAISPNMPGQRAGGWVCTFNTAPNEYMYIGDGYWVFITKPTTLAGFLMSPWYLLDFEMEVLDCELPPRLR